MTAAFLDALGLERITAQTFADTDNLSIRPQILHGPHASLERRLRTLNDQGAGVFTMINQGDLRGRRAENVQAVTCYFADLDGVPLLDEYPLEPTAVVESSPRRYHLYWRVTDAPKKLFAHVQQHVAALLGSDPKVCDLPRVMRLPGYVHRKGEPFESRTLQLEPAAVYTHAVFTEAFGVPEKKVAPPMPKAVTDYCQGVTGGRGANRHKLLDRVATAGSGTRNDTLFRMSAALANDVKAGALEEDVMRAELAEAAALCGLPEHEIERTISSALRYG